MLHHRVLMPNLLRSKAVTHPRHIASFRDEQPQTQQVTKQPPDIKLHTHCLQYFVCYPESFRVCARGCAGRAPTSEFEWHRERCTDDPGWVKVHPAVGQSDSQSASDATGRRDVPFIHGHRVRAQQPQLSVS